MTTNQERIERRRFLALAAMAAQMCVTPAAFGAGTPRRLVFVHGRSQQGKDPAALKAEWLATFRRGVEAAGRSIPDGIEVAMPFYGDALDELSRQIDLPLTTDVQTKGAEIDDEFLQFQFEAVEEMRRSAGVSDAQVRMEAGDAATDKGPQNWKWVLAATRALDKNFGGLSQSAIEHFLRDVFLYTRRSGVREEIDRIVGMSLNEEPTIVVGHSLGSVVAYNVLRTDLRKLQIPLYLTIGSPLAIRAVRNQFLPLKFPAPLTRWYNAFDPRDIVALNPLDEKNFPVTPAIQNYAAVQNHTDNRHGIVGYLDDKEVAKQVLTALTA